MDNTIKSLVLKVAKETIGFDITPLSTTEDHLDTSDAPQLRIVNDSSYKYPYDINLFPDAVLLSDLSEDNISFLEEHGILMEYFEYTEPERVWTCRWWDKKDKQILIKSDQISWGALAGRLWIFNLNTNELKLVAMN